ncbi:MAG: SDR family oxidoreductase [Verrucomicrobia bacterium]|nr:SDR family oxidoreductase [Verrucomicrobiota bacterium]
MILDAKKILITGGASGIGLETLRVLSEAGAIVGVLDFSEDKLAQLAQTWPGVPAVRCDVTRPEEVHDAVISLADKLDGIDGLVNCAGILASAPLLSVGAQGLTAHTLELWDRVLQANLSSVFYVTRAVVTHMVKRRAKGVVVNVSSVSAGGNAGQGAYSAAKAGVNALTVTWAKELGPWGIRVVGVAPGFCDTPSMHAAMPDAVLQHIVGELPLKRLGHAADIAETIVHLFRNDFCNGKVFEVDGGLRV